MAITGSGSSYSQGGYTFGQLMGFWINAGGNPAVAPQMAALAMAESNGSNVIQQGQPYATTGWGLWQITPGNSETQCGTDNALLNPATNACAAVAKYNAAGGFGPWTTFGGSRYLAALRGGTGATADLSVSAKTTAPSAAPGSGSKPGAGGTGGGGGPVGCGAKGNAGNIQGCLVPFPLSFSIPLIGSIGGCILTSCQAKAIISVAEIGAGGFSFLFGVVMIAGFVYDRSGARQAVTSTARRVGMGTALLTGQPEVAAGIMATGRGGGRRGGGGQRRYVTEPDAFERSEREGARRRGSVLDYGTGGHPKELVPGWNNGNGHREAETRRQDPSMNRRRRMPEQVFGSSRAEQERRRREGFAGEGAGRARNGNGNGSRRTHLGGGYTQTGNRVTSPKGTTMARSTYDRLKQETPELL